MSQIDVKDKVMLIFDGSNEIGMEILNKLIKIGGIVYTFVKDEKTNHLGLFQTTHSSMVKIGSFNFEKNAYKLAIDLLVSRENKIDVAVNNLEDRLNTDVVEVTPEEWLQAIDKNLHQPFEILTHIVPIMKCNGGGSIINISSTSAIHGGTGDVVYASAKSSLDSMTKALSRELGPHQIRINGIAVGELLTNTLMGVDKLNDIPLGRYVTPTDVANVTLFLSSSLSSYITGQTILLDGGSTFS